MPLRILFPLTRETSNSAAPRPLVAHPRTRSVLDGMPGAGLPPLQQACDAFAVSFLRRVAVSRLAVGCRHG